jgi:acid phosphatase
MAGEAPDATDHASPHFRDARRVVMTKPVTNTLRFVCFALTALTISTVPIIKSAGVSHFLSELKVPSDASQVPKFKKVIVVLFENHDLASAIAEPTFTDLEKYGVVLLNYRGITHPSEPNYIAMVSGKLDYSTTPGVWVGDEPGVYPPKTGESLSGKQVNVVVDDDEMYDLPGPHLGDLLEAAKLTWKNFAEDYPGTLETCYKRSRSIDPKTKKKGNYTRRHTPFMSFQNLTGAHTPSGEDSRCREHIINASAFEADLNSGNLPNFSFLTPNLVHDAHDSSIKIGGQWLQSTFGPHLGKHYMGDVLLIVTFDENSCNTVGSDQKNQDNNIQRCKGDENIIYTALLGNSVRLDLKRFPKAAPPFKDPHGRRLYEHVDGNGEVVPSVEARYDHFNLLRTIEVGFGLGDLGENDKREVKKYSFDDRTRKTKVEDGSGVETQPITGIWRVGP